MTTTAEAPPGWKADVTATVVLLSLGLLATVAVGVIDANWLNDMGSTLYWARWMLLSVQAGLLVITVALCVWRIQRRRVAVPFALVGGGVATVFFWVASFALVASLPCPSFC